MKLNAKLILFAFVIVVITSTASAIIYYSLTNRLLQRYQSQSILTSTNDFIFAFQNSVEQIQYDFRKILPNLTDTKNINLDSTSIDFIFTLENDSFINVNNLFKNKNSNLNIATRSFKKFFVDNPNVILFYTPYKNDILYYGKAINYDFLNKIAEKTRVDIALVINNELYEFSNSDKNKILIPVINKSIQNLKFKNSYDLYYDQLESADYYAALYTPKQILTPGGKFNFIIFSSYEEAASFRLVLRNVIILIVIAISTLTFLFVLVFTYKFRKQITLLSEATEITARGNLNHRVTVIIKDEIGKLGHAFNRMLDVIQKKEELEQQYIDFIKLVNQNPTLKEVSEAALEKIINATKCSFGLLYVLENKKLRLISSYGINRETVESRNFSEIYSNVIDKKETREFIFNENFPEINTGLTSIKLKYLLIYPILYNKETIALLELASTNIPDAEVKSYLDNVHEHFAIGLVNAMSLEQLENYITELRKLNDEYQKQNTQITIQNEELKELHKQLKEKADELEKQKQKAIELTKVKSQFLASMSHELRTPLISIIGLSELLLKEFRHNQNLYERLNIIYRNGKKLLKLITNILEFSRIESGKIEIKKEKFLLNELIDELRQNFESSARDKKLKLVIDLPTGKNILLNTDKSKLDHILSNLLMNAIKFTDAGEVRLSVELLDNQSIKFTVSDTGIGISEENKEIIFSEFKQIETGNSKHFGGTGLGLTICKRYVELLGSHLSLESKLGEGTKFSFILNDIIVELIDVDESEFLKLENNIENNEQPSALIIGSNENANKLIKDYLNTYNYQLITSDNKKTSLDVIAKQKINSIIINSAINDSDIWNLLALIRRNPLANDVPIILCNVMEKEKLGWAPCIFDYQIKPVNDITIGKLLQQIELFAGVQIEKIIYVSGNKAEFEILKDAVLPKFNVEWRNTLESAMSLIDYSQSQLYLIDVETFKSDALLFSSLIRQNKYTRNIFVVFLLPDSLNEEDVKELTNTFNALTLREKNHPLDILKFIKDRLQIDDSEANKRLNLMIETSIINKNPVEHSDNLNKPTIMIVDDDEDTLFTIGEILKELNCNTIYAHNGMECLLTLNHILPDLIFLDIMMPVMDGFETIKRIRSSSRTANLPVIALTAYAMLENKEVIEKNGFNDLVTKPVDSSTILNRVNNFLKVKV